MSKKIGGFTEDHLVGVARDAVKKKTKNTVVLDTEAEERIPKFDSAGKHYSAVRFLSRACDSVPFSLAFSSNPQNSSLAKSWDAVAFVS